MGSCTCQLSRRGFLTGGGAAATTALAGCDRIDLPNLVSDQQAEAMGLRAWEDIRQTTQISQDSWSQNRLDRIARRLLEASGEDPMAWEVTLFADSQVNAFALPGRKIGVYQGMMQLARADAQLAAVVGHEIGHVQAEHAQERMSAEVAKNFGLRLIALVLQVGEVEFAQGIAAALGLGAQYGLIMPYNRSQELEADRLGLEIMARADYDPQAAVALWQDMDAQGGERPPAFLSTHPAPQARIEEIRDMIGTLPRG
jgi:predicted Zn-dependent protease